MRTDTFFVKRIICILMSAILVISMTACGASADTPAEPASEAQSEAEATEEETSEAEDVDMLFSDSDVKTETDDAGDVEKEAAASADSDVEAVPYLEFDYKTVLDDKEKKGDTVIYEGSFSWPVLSEASALTYPELAKALEDDSEEAYEGYAGSRKESVKEAEERYGEEPEFFDNGNYSYHTEAWLRRADDKVTSFVTYFSTFLGGAHGLEGQFGYTYDTKTGKRLGLKDVIKDTSTLNDILEKEILANYDAEIFGDLKGSLDQYDPDITEYTVTDSLDGDSYPYQWCLLPVGIEFYFGPYSLAYYAAGAQDVILTYEDYPDLFTEEYKTDGDQGFVYEFLGDLEPFDLTGDGKRDSLWVEALDTDEYDYANGLCVTLNDKKEEVKDISFYNRGGSTRSAYYIRTADGKQYIYTEVMIDGMEDGLFVFEINKDRAKFVDSTDMHLADTVKYDDDFIWYRMTGTDPDSMELFRQVDIFVTCNAMAHCHVGIKGMPEVDEAYRPVGIGDDRALISKIELTCDIVDEDGKVISEKEKIKAGESFLITATDAESYVDARMSDDRIARIYVTGYGYDWKIDGVQDRDCFEVLYLAG